MPILDLIPPLLEGLGVTLQLTAGGAALAFVMAWIAGVGKLSRIVPLRWVSSAYVEVFRGTSALVQLFWFYYALPFFGPSLTPMTAGILVLGLNVGSYGAEVVRGAIQSVEKGQRDAARALNFSELQTLWFVVVPQAVIAMLPPAGNLLIELLKNTALVSLITLSDLTYSGKLLRDQTLQTTEIFGLLLLIYFAVALILTFGMRTAERRLARGWHLGGQV